ncbi:MAG: ketopantoate reductase family protein, partial [Chloroflexota bacterium]|nr:ketopantoate reductase family protein [Chloroflexota bacterium]
ALARRPLAITPDAAGAAPLTVPVAAITGLDQLREPPSLVVLTVKSFDTVGAIPDLQRLAAGGATVLTFQNGVGNEEALVAALGAPAVRSGAFTVSVSAPEPGLVRRHTAGGGFGFAPVAGEDLGPLLALFRPAGLPLVTARSHRVLKWSKLLLNLLGNAQSALLDLPPATIFADPRLFALERRAFAEARAAMRAAGIGLVDLPAYPVRALAVAMALPAPLSRRLLAGRAGGGRGAKMPSLHLDLAVGRGRSEVPWYNGAVVELGGRVGVPTPVNAALTRLLGRAVADPAAWAPFRGRPERLLAEVSAAE